MIPLWIEDPSSNYQYPYKESDLTVCACTPGTGDKRQTDSESLLSRKFSKKCELPVQWETLYQGNKIERVGGNIDIFLWSQYACIHTDLVHATHALKNVLTK